MIICVLLNPTIDTLIQIPRFEKGSTYQIQDKLQIPAGKAISVALTISTLGIKPFVIAFVGKKELETYEFFLDEHHIDHFLIPVDGKTRSNITIIDSEQNISTHIRFLGFSIDPKNIKTLESKLETQIHNRDLVVFSGSSPPGTPRDFYEKISHLIHQKEAKFILDTSGEWIQDMQRYHPYLIKNNIEEISTMLKMPLIDGVEFQSKPTDEDLQLLLKKSEMLNTWESVFNIITLAKYGAIGFNKKDAYHSYLSLEKAPYTIGCGDSFLGGFLTGMEIGHNFEESLRLATACGAANTQTLGPGLIDKRIVDKYLSQVVIRKLKLP